MPQAADTQLPDTDDAQALSVPPALDPSVPHLGHLVLYKMHRENWMPAALGCSKALPAIGILRSANTETCAMCLARGEKA